VTATALARFATSIDEVQGEKMNKAPASVVASAQGRGAVEIRRYSKTMGYVLGSDLVDDLVTKAGEHDEFINDYLACRPYLQAAVRSGVDPLAALETLLVVEAEGHLAVNWQGLAGLMSRTPIPAMVGEHGEGLGRGRLRAEAASFGGADDDDYSSFED